MATLTPKIVSLRTSFTAEEIVAKMLGWLRGPSIPANIEITTLAPFNETQLIKLSTLELSLEEHLTQLLNAAIDDYGACGAKGGSAIAWEKEEEIERIEELSKKAMRYTADLKHEIMKGRGSMLEEDPNEIGPNGEPCYGITSADKWAKASHGISIINYVEPVYVPKEDTLVVDRDGKGSENGLSKTITNNLYITLALLIEAFIQANPNYSDDLKEMMNPGYQGLPVPEKESIENTNLVVSKLGQYLSYRSKIPGSRAFAKGQSDEAIMTHIENALAYKAKVWSERKAQQVRKRT